MGKIKISLTIDDGKIESEVKMTNASLIDLSLACPQLDLTKLKLLNQIAKMSQKGGMVAQ